MNFGEAKILELNCTSENYVLNTFFSSISNEFVFSCIQKNPIFLMKRIDQNFHIFNEEYFQESSFNCFYLSSYSIVYIKNYNAYVSIIQSNCNGGEGIRFFELSNLCKMGNIRGPISEEEGEEGNKLTQEISKAINFSSIPSDYSQFSVEDYYKSDKNTLSTLVESDKSDLSDLYIKGNSQTYIEESSDFINYQSTEFIGGRTEKIDSTDNKEKLSDIKIKTDKIKEIISDSNEGGIKVSLSD
jgi:hypothetical protein